MKKKRRKRSRGRARTIDKWQLKEWYDVFAPKTFNEAFIGKIPTSDPDSLIGKTIESRLYTFTNNLQHSHIKLKFKITEVNGKRCSTRLWGYQLTRDFIASLVHRGTSRIDGIFNYTTADGFIYRVSTFIVTVRCAKRSQRTTIRRIAHDVLTEFAKNMNHDQFIRGIIYGKFANNISRIARTIYPLRECQIRKIKVIHMPEEVEDIAYSDDEMEFEEVEIELEEHGKSVKAKEKAKKREKRMKEREVDKEESELSEEEEEKTEESEEEEESEAAEEIEEAEDAEEAKSAD